MYNSWVEVSKSAILHNLAQYKKIVGKDVEAMPIVKSNAYGHGMIAVSKLVAPKVRWLGVVNLAEALELRRNDIRKKIFVLSYCQPNLLKQGIKQNISLPVYSFDFAVQLSKLATRLHRRVKIHIKIDTGTTRVGVLTKDALSFIKKVSQLPNLKIEGVYSHFAASEENSQYTKFQLANFNRLLVQLAESKIKIAYKHFACSAASLVEKKSHFNLIRLGLSLYGLWPSPQAKQIALKNYPWLRLKPALSWQTNIIQVKAVPIGTKVGYGGTHTTKKKTKIAVLPVGYWEGYDRHLSNQGEVLIKGKRCRVLGRVCMNLTMVDVTSVKVAVGDVVVLLGKQGREGISADELATRIGTINYEVVTRINPVLPRVLI